jgi:hypothetical protein
MGRQRYDAVLDIHRKLGHATTGALLDSLERNAVVHAVVHAETEGGEDAGALSEATAELVAEHADVLSGFGTVTLPPATAGKPAREVQVCADLGLTGVNIQPAFGGMDITDRRLYPAYARAEELGLIVALHTGINYSRVYPMSHERPDLVDQVACDFPDLRIIACHAGWPWATEFAAVARRHPTVYLEFGGLAPKYVTQPGTGWDVLATYANNILSDQILFATDWPVFDHERAVREWQTGALSERSLKKLFYGNARALFGLPGQLAAVDSLTPTPTTASTG